MADPIYIYFNTRIGQLFEGPYIFHFQFSLKKPNLIILFKNNNEKAPIVDNIIKIKRTNFLNEK